jgi:hypothetical protein
MQPKLEDSPTNELTSEATPANRPKPKPGPRPTPPPKPTPSTTPWITYVGLVVAVLALFSFGLLIMYMLTRTSDATELEWQRDVYLLSGVEAVAFAAAGFLFGKEVHRQQAEQATARADKAEEKAAEAQQNAQVANRTAIEVRTRARALTAAINAKAESYAQEATTRHVSPPAPIESMAPISEQVQQPPAAQPPLSQADLLELQRLAKELFP